MLPLLLDLFLEVVSKRWPININFMVDVQQKQNKNAVSVFEAHPEIEDNLI